MGCRGIMRLQSQQGFVPCWFLWLVIPALINWPSLIEVLVKGLFVEISFHTWPFFKLPTILKLKIYRVF